MPAELKILAVLLIVSLPLAARCDVAAFVDKHCLECHDSDSRKGELDLEALAWNPLDRDGLATWIDVFDRVANGDMPPAKKPRPEAASQTAFLAQLEKRLYAAQAAHQAQHGRVGVRRLNRLEYANTVNELLGISLPLQRQLPVDGATQGFNTVAAGLRLSPLHIEKYFEAADSALDEALVFQPSPASEVRRYSYKEEKEAREILDTPQGKVKDAAGNKHQVILRELDDAVVFFSTGFWPTELRQFRAPAAGEYRIRISAYAFQNGTRHALMRVYTHKYAEKTLLGYFEMPPDTPRVVEMQARLEQGAVLNIVPQDIGYDEAGKSVWNIPGPEFGGSGLAVQWVEIEGPLGEPGVPPSLKLLADDLPITEIPDGKRPWRHGKRVHFALEPEAPKAALRQAIAAFAQRATRRPIDSEVTERFVSIAEAALDDGRRFEEALRLGLRAVLTAPEFLFFHEPPGKLDGYALASRLSYFLWRHMPDAELLAKAASNRLHDPEVLRSEVDRLLDHPRAQAFVGDFCGQWLDLQRIDATSPDAKLYPEFDELLKLAIVGESEAFFAHLLAKDLPVANFIDSDFLLLNGRIADHYGIDSVVGEEFRPVLRPPDSPRGGLLTQAAILKVTANGTVTSPVMRGAWMMKRLLGKPPRPPPPNVGAIEPDTRGATTVREQLAKHRNSPSCASCHRDIDPPGFALESFDVIGGWRERYRSLGEGDKAPGRLRGQGIWQYRLGQAVDASGVMPDGRAFRDVREFKELLLQQEPQVLRNLAEQLVTFGTGAAISFADRRELDRVAASTKAQGGGLRSLVHAIVQSPLFTHN
jgi:hypothetical protein